ncbi:MAG: hypothetical protein LBM77_01615, partial [Spirochaetaceae bacterium]|nr:hypothetical protein [Spirochaetaceae bacterium]
EVNDQNILGCAYSDGYVPLERNGTDTCEVFYSLELPDYTKSAYWHKMAADNGKQHSQIHLADYYLEGKGVEKDINQALLYLVKATQGNDEYWCNSAKNKIKDITGMSYEQFVLKHS